MKYHDLYSKVVCSLIESGRYEKLTNAVQELCRDDLNRVFESDGAEARDKLLFTLTANNIAWEAEAITKAAWRSMVATLDGNSG